MSFFIKNFSLFSCSLTLLFVIKISTALAANNSGAAFTIWPGTGQESCFNEEDKINCPATDETFYGQDAQYSNSFRSYTAFDANGNPVDVSSLNINCNEEGEICSGSVNWVTVKDNVTGLVWEVKTDDESIHNRYNKYLWCDQNTTTNGGNEGVCGFGSNTKNFIDELNSANFGGYSDWRLPTVNELSSLYYHEYGSDYNNNVILKIDTNYFPINPFNSPGEELYWSGTTDITDNNDAYTVNFFVNLLESEIRTSLKSMEFNVRAVRGGSGVYTSNFVDNLDGTISDLNTGLMWQKETADWWGDSNSDEMTWKFALSYCESLELANYTDWRLPNPNELQSIMDYSREVGPLIDETYFPDSSHTYWTSTTDQTNSSYKVGWWATVVRFSSHWWYSIDSYLKTEMQYTRAVRGGYPALLVNLEGDGKGVVGSDPHGINCDFECYKTYSTHQVVTLSATPEEGSIFVGWSGGGCSGINDCTITMDKSRKVTATFKKPFPWEMFLPSIISQKKE